MGVDKACGGEPGSEKEILAENRKSWKFTRFG